MKKSLLAVVVASLALSADAQVRSAVDHTPISCVRAGELPLLQVRATGKGELRGFFRRVNSSDWCSVIGLNDGALSRVVLPKFENGDEIEYFFVLTEGIRVIGRSPRIYRVGVANSCETAFARHVLPLSMNCGPNEQVVPSSHSAGYMIGDQQIDEEPPPISPEGPNSGNGQ